MQQRNGLVGLEERVSIVETPTPPPQLMGVSEQTEGTQYL